MMCTGRTV